MKPTLDKTVHNQPGGSWALVITLIFVVIAGAFLRFSDLSAPLLDFHPTRQLFGAIKARGLYYQTLPDAPAWQKDLAQRQYNTESIIEPPLLENASARLYSVFGEQTAIPRALSATFWMVGGIFLFLLARNLNGSSLAAISALAFYLLLPYGVTASRSFQPDPLMVMLIIAFWWSIENWGRSQMFYHGSSAESWAWAILSGLFGGLAIFAKFPAAFFVLGGVFGVIIGYKGLLKSLKLLQTWAMAFLGVLPTGIYLYYGFYINGSLGQQFGSRFYPELWISPFFYLRWFLKVQNIASVLWLVPVVFGWLLFSSRPSKVFLAGLWTAYLLYGLTFAHHISSHDYYSLPLVPIIALCLAPLVPHILPVFLYHLRTVMSSQSSRAQSLALRTALALLLVSISLFSINQYLQQRSNDMRPAATFWAQVGDAIGHQPGVLALTADYGYPLAYYGWQNSDPWPLAPDIKNFDETFSNLSSNRTYFLVTDSDEYARQPNLQKKLTENYPVLVQGNGFVVFDLYHPYPAK